MLICGLKMLYFFCIFLVSVTKIDAAKILAVFPTPSISHQIVYRPLTQELARRGHELVILTPNPAFQNDQAPPNFIEIDVQNISYAMKDALMLEAYNSKQRTLSQMKLLAQLFSRVFKVQLENKQFQNVLRLNRKHFDLLLVEACVSATLGLSYVFDAPVIQISSFGTLMTNHHALGIPMHPFLYPTSMRKRLYNLSITEKLGTLMEVSIAKYVIASTESSDNELLREHFGPDIPSLDKLINNVDMLFLNTHPIWSGNYPVPPNVIFVRGIHEVSRKALPEDLQSFLDKSKHGVIYVSFGTNVIKETFSISTKQILIKVFSDLPYDILWKWHEEVPSLPENIKISKWLPQADLLCHPNIKLFITQGGLQSTDEAISAGVPLIGIPILADQSYNAEKYEHFQIGMKLNVYELTVQKLNDSIHKIIGDQNYYKNIVKLRTLMNDQPQSPLDTAVWWAEYVLRNGGSRHLRSPAANMSWFEYFEVKLVIIVILVLTVLTISWALALKILLNKIIKMLTKAKVKSD